jgi:hypothetical protein
MICLFDFAIPENLMGMGAKDQFKVSFRVQRVRIKISHFLRDSWPGDCRL